MLLELQIHPGAVMMAQSASVGMSDEAAAFAKALPLLASPVAAPAWQRMIHAAEKLASEPVAGSC